MMAHEAEAAGARRVVPGVGREKRPPQTSHRDTGGGARRTSLGCRLRSSCVASWPARHRGGRLYGGARSFPPGFQSMPVSVPCRTATGAPSGSLELLSGGGIHTRRALPFRLGMLGVSHLTMSCRSFPC